MEVDTPTLIRGLRADGANPSTVLQLFSFWLQTRATELTKEEDMTHEAAYLFGLSVELTFTAKEIRQEGEHD